MSRWLQAIGCRWCIKPSFRHAGAVQGYGPIRSAQAASLSMSAIIAMASGMGTT